MNQYPNQESDSLPRKHDHWARATALGAAGISFLALSGEAASAQEYSQHVESPQALISRVDKNLVDVQGRIMASRGVKVVPAQALKKTPGIKVYYTASPNKANAHLYDIIEITVRKGQKQPLLSSISIGANSNKWKGTTNHPEVIAISQSANFQTAFTPGSVEVWTFQAGEVARYGVSTKNYDGKHPQFGKSSGGDLEPTGAATVSQQFDAFFHHADEILGVE